MIEITPPSDKSISHRAAILSALSKKPVKIKGFLKAEDTLSTLSCLKALSVKIEERKDGILIQGEGLREPKEALYCGNSGTTMRLLMGTLAPYSFSAELTGDSSLSKRPMERVAEPLRAMGAEIELSDGKPPVRIKGGKLNAISYQLKQASAQVKSAILIAGLSAEGRTVIEEPGISRDHTERMLEFFGVPIKKGGRRTELIGPAELRGEDITVPGDFSSAAFFIGASLITKREVLIKDVGINPTRTGFLRVLKDMGAEIEIENEKSVCNELVGDIIVRKNELKGIEVQKELIPQLIDEVPILAVCALFAEGETTIRGAEELRVKESDRIKAIVTEFSKLSAKIEELSDGMVIEGGFPLKGTRLSSHNDHRIAMALSVLSLCVPDVEVEGSECVDISFPGFHSQLSFWR
jgi:3-phosphoshikimate 1-carboxyvinyltransferase